MNNILENIHQFGLKFLQPLTLEQTYALIAKEATKLVKADWGSLYIPSGNHLKSATVFPTSSKLQYSPRPRGFTYKAYAENKIFVINGKDMLVKFHNELKGKNFHSAICLPISYQKKGIGALVLFSQQNHKFTSKEKNALKVFGSYASIAIRKMQLYEETREALETRDVFIALASHELRTPLTTINGYVQLLQHRISKFDQTEAKWIEHLSWETKRLTLLIKELLEINLIKSGKLQFNLKECNLSEIVERVRADFSFKYPERKLVINNAIKKGKDVAIGDFNKLLQTFSNLINNAAKFSTKETEIIFSLEEDEENFCIKITDHGHGISIKDLPKISAEFYKAFGNLKEGMGLGLFLAKYVINRHKGKMKIYSEEQKGTTIEIILPQVKKDE